MASRQSVLAGIKKRQSKVYLAGALTFGTVSWFMVGRKGWGVLFIFSQLFSLLFMFIGGFMSFIILWAIGIFVPPYLLRKDAVDDALFSTADRIEMQKRVDEMGEGI